MPNLSKIYVPDEMYYFVMAQKAPSMYIQALIERAMVKKKKE